MKPSQETESNVVVGPQTKMSARTAIAIIIACVAWCGFEGQSRYANQQQNKMVNWRLSRIEIKLGITDVPPIAYRNDTNMAVAYRYPQKPK